MEYKHFSHHHNLNIHHLPPGHQVHCSGCESPCGGSTSVHGCAPCNFYLHHHCANANRFVKHPSHKLHPLILLPHPTYAGATFYCNACGNPGKAFSYACAPCEIDLHIGCAFLPPTVTHKAHQHQLHLTHGGAAAASGSAQPPEFCKICSKAMEPRHWAYWCDKASCGFGVHTFCATTEVCPGLYQDDGDAGGDHGGAVEQQAAPPQGDVVEVELTAEEVIQLYNLGIQMQMAEQVAQAMAKLSTVG